MRFVTFTQAEWGAAPAATNAAATLARRFTALYPYGASVGGPYRIRLTSARAVERFLPQSGTPAALRRNWTNPMTTEAGSLAGEVFALRFNLDFSAKGYLPMGFANLKIAPGHKLEGRTVREVYRLANETLGGNRAALPAGCSTADFTGVLAGINSNFIGGQDRGWLIPLAP